QLTSLTYTLGSNVLGDLSYLYDLAGNRVSVGGSWARVSLPAAVPSATYDAGNRLTRRGSQQLSYDANGSLASDGFSDYGWNARNQLVAIGGNTSAAFQYDAFGRRSARS